jgi:hypothetical protein
MTRLGWLVETAIENYRVGVSCLRLVQGDITSIHWTPGVSEHVPARR